MGPIAPVLLPKNVNNCRLLGPLGKVTPSHGIALHYQSRDRNRDKHWLHLHSKGPSGKSGDGNLVREPVSLSQYRSVFQILGL